MCQSGLRMKFKTVWLSGAVLRFWNFIFYFPSSRTVNLSNDIKNVWKQNHLTAYKALSLLHFEKNPEQTSCLEVSSVASLQICRNLKQNKNLKIPAVRKQSIMELRYLTAYFSAQEVKIRQSIAPDKTKQNNKQQFFCQK